MECQDYLSFSQKPTNQTCNLDVFPPPPTFYQNNLYIYKLFQKKAILL